MLRSVSIIDGERSTWSESRTADRLDGTGQGHTWRSGALGDCPGSASPGSTCVCPRPGPAGTVPAECQRPACRHCAVPRKTSWRPGGGPPRARPRGGRSGSWPLGPFGQGNHRRGPPREARYIPSRGGLLSALVFRVWARVDTNRSFGLWPRVAASLLRWTTAIDQRRRLYYPTRGLRESRPDSRELPLLDIRSRPRHAEADRRAHRHRAPNRPSIG